MRALSAHDILRVWEAGADQDSVTRALTILAAASPGAALEDLAALHIGERDARLLVVRERTFGQTLDGYAECPRCGASLVFDLSTADVRAQSPLASSPEGCVLTVPGYEVRFRLPDSQDLCAVLACRDVPSGRRTLLMRCVLQVNRASLPVDTDEFPAEVVAALAERMAECDPRAEVTLALTCQVCGHPWEMLLDIVAFFWTEIRAEVARVAREVHRLARAYGWREADILAMSPVRRQLYLEMVIA